ncbi:MAG: GNAT family N-acetyltransferase [Desulfosoma sp.]
MRVVILHSAVPSKALPDEEDVLVQAGFLGEALTRLGHDVIFLPFSSHLEAGRWALRDLRPDLVFNLVETVEGTGRLIHVAPGLLDVEGFPYTGCSTEAVFVTSHKVLTKYWLTAYGLPTPAWFEPNKALGLGNDCDQGDLGKAVPFVSTPGSSNTSLEASSKTRKAKHLMPVPGSAEAAPHPYKTETGCFSGSAGFPPDLWGGETSQLPWENALWDKLLGSLQDWMRSLGTESFAIVKPLWEDASVGIDQEAVVSLHDLKTLDRAMTRARHRFGPDGFFVEHFIDGREFNLSLLSSPDGVQVLPPAEMCFVGFSSQKHRIVDYEAKWVAGSFAERNTMRSFSFSEEDAPLLDRLCGLAQRCWNIFGLRGYARIDFRVDWQGRPWILEINANPCLAPDAGFMAAADQAGLNVDDVVQRLIDDAFKARRFPRSLPEDKKRRYLSRKRGPLARHLCAWDDRAPRVTIVPGHDSRPVFFSSRTEVDEADLSFRNYLVPSDLETLDRITAQTGFFNEEELSVARDLARQSLGTGAESGYFFVLSEYAGRVVGYTCYGPILGTAGRYELYWIVVDPAFQGQGIGRKLLQETESAIGRAGGQRVYVETSSRDTYEPTRRFYVRAGYAFVALHPDFYGPEDHKIIYAKELS